MPVSPASGIKFVAYNALAAGLLTGKHQPPKEQPPVEDREVAAGRFKNNPNYLPRFYTDANFNAVAMVYMCVVWA